MYLFNMHRITEQRTTSLSSSLLFFCPKTNSPIFVVFGSKIAISIVLLGVSKIFLFDWFSVKYVKTYSLDCLCQGVWVTYLSDVLLYIFPKDVGQFSSWMWLCVFHFVVSTLTIQPSECRTGCYQSFVLN